MASYLPGKTEEQLKTMGGQDIKSSLTVLKNKYQVAADVIDRKLTFGEVKQQIDNGQPIEMDVFDKDNDAPRGTENNSGHAILIVGYVIPKDGDISTHAPYYEIWNPWWGKTFYVSSSASIINLCGTDYEWTRTWYNWRKTTASQSIQVDTNLGEKKVASTGNPRSFYTLNEQNKSLSSLLDHTIVYQPNTTAVNPVDLLLKPTFSVQNKVLEGRLSEMGKVHSFSTLFAHTNYAYSESNDGGSVVYARIDGRHKTHTANDSTKRFITAYKGIQSSEQRIVFGLTIAMALALITAVLGGVTAFVIEVLLDKFGSPYSAANAVVAVQDFFSYSNEADKYFNQI